MKWLIIRHGYYLPMIKVDFYHYAKECEECQRFRPLQKIPAKEMHAMVKSWPLRGWAMNIIGKIYPASSKRHNFILFP